VFEEAPGGGIDEGMEAGAAVLAVEELTDAARLLGGLMKGPWVKGTGS
jgi:hypothetical protein